MFLSAAGASVKTDTLNTTSAKVKVTCKNRTLEVVDVKCKSISFNRFTFISTSRNNYPFIYMYVQTFYIYGGLKNELIKSKIKWEKNK